MIKKLVLIRHGQTVYNRDKIFCGWTDVDLTEQGIAEATSAGKNLKKAGYIFDIAFCSVLKRARETLSILLDEMGVDNLPINYTWKLNERHYGDLQGQKHADVAAVTPYWENDIVPQVKSGKNVIVAASGNSLRSLVKYIDNISDDDIVGLEIKTGTPLVYELDDNLKPIRKYYLLDNGVEEPIELFKKG